MFEGIGMKLLYLSCHSVLEYDELSLLTELGLDVFSLGAYTEPRSTSNARPALIGLRHDPEDLAAYHELAGQVGDIKCNLTKEFVDRFDVVMIMHMPQWVSRNWEVLRHKQVIWRTIGQSMTPLEKLMARYRADGLKIVRYSPMEENIPGYCGADAVIRFYKDPDEFKGWIGHDRHVITSSQLMVPRPWACNYFLYQRVTAPFPRKLYGSGNEEAGPFSKGDIPFEELKQALRAHRVYFSTGTRPASYTLNFIEAWMTGIPVVVIGPKLGNDPHFPDHDLYEIPRLISCGKDGFWSDDEQQLQEMIQSLLNDESLACRISECGRRTAIKYFGKATIKKQWNQFWEMM